MVKPRCRDSDSEHTAMNAQAERCAYTTEELADLLHALDVPFVRGDPQQAPDLPADLTGMIVALAGNEESRLRLALIPLFLRHPAFAPYAQTAAAQLSGDLLLVLRCYTIKDSPKACISVRNFSTGGSLIQRMSCQSA